MKSIIEGLNKEFESRVRLGIMSSLQVNEWAEFKELREWLQVTDGNLASHIAALEKRQYVEVKKEFVGKKPKTSFRSTKLGQAAFKAHLAALERLLGR